MIRFCAAVLAISLTACATAPDSPDATASPKASRGRYGSEGGEMTVGIVAGASIRDESRSREIPLSIDYPSRATEAAPVILFSHALGASELDYPTYAAHWASNGYVVIRVGHSDAVRGFQRDRQEANVTPASAAEWVGRAQDRARDLKFVAESFDLIEQRYPELAGKLDRNRVGVAGHAFGALAAMIGAGVRTFPGGASTQSSVIKAVIALSPPGPGERRSLTAESFRTLTVPSLFLTGTRDLGGDDTETPQWREQGFEAAAAGDKWFVSLNGAGRNTFSGLLMDEPVRDRVDRSDPNRQNPMDDPIYRQTDRRLPGEMAGGARMILARARSITLAFWDAYLRKDAAGREFLDSLAAKEWGVIRQR